MSGIKRQERDLRPALVFLTGDLIAVPIPLDREEVVLGRALEADVRINDSKVSRLHARILTIENARNRKNRIYSQRSQFTQRHASQRRKSEQ